MATNSLITFFFILTILLLSCHTLPSLSSSQHQDITDSSFVRQLDPTTFTAKTEKLSQFRFYWHDTLSGINPTSVTVIPPPFGFSKLHNDNTFGLVNVIDNPLTSGPELNSTLVGKAQGFYVSASQTEFDLLMAMNFAFVVGKYNGSTITVLGRNPIYNKVRELPVIGGSGLFRFARGYAEARTHWFEPNTGDAVVEYTVYVFHY